MKDSCNCYLFTMLNSFKGWLFVISEASVNGCCSVLKFRRLFYILIFQRDQIGDFCRLGYF